MLQSLISLIQNMAFLQSLRNIRLSGDSTLLAECLKHDGTYTFSDLDLDTSIGNNKGHFDTSSTEYSRSATNVKLSDTMLSADLLRSNAPSLHDSIDLNTIVANHDGVLAFQK